MYNNSVSFCLTAITPPPPPRSGKKLQDLFPGSSSSSSQAQNHNPLEFTEPARLNNGKIRWQIIQLRADHKTTAPTSSTSSSPVSSEHRHKLQTDASQRRDSSKEKKEGKSRDELNSGSSEGNRERGVEFERAAGKREEREGDLSPLAAFERSPQSKAGDDTMIEEIFKRGVYLKPDSTLKELRNSFIDSIQLDSNDCTFRFLRSDVPGDFIDIDTEDKTLLSQIQHSLVLPATLYIESIVPGDLTTNNTVHAKSYTMCSNDCFCIALYNS